jgi:hypothetical protein
MAKNMLPYLALDSAGEKTILCDYPVKMFDNTTTKEKKAKMAHIMTNQEVQSHTKKLVSRLLGQDAAVDDETAARIKEFLKTKLSPGDHAQVCDMLEAAAGDPETEAQDDLPENAVGRPPQSKRGSAGVTTDAASFNVRFPGLSHVRLDNSGIQPRARGGSYSDAAARSFADRYPGLQGIRRA